MDHGFHLLQLLARKRDLIHLTQYTILNTAVKEHRFFFSTDVQSMYECFVCAHMRTHVRVQFVSKFTMMRVASLHASVLPGPRLDCLY